MKCQQDGVRITRRRVRCVCKSSYALVAEEVLAVAEEEARKGGVGYLKSFSDGLVMLSLLFWGENARAIDPVQEFFHNCCPDMIEVQCASEVLSTKAVCLIVDV